jgi:hypothetical protein
MAREKRERTLGLHASERHVDSVEMLQNVPFVKVLIVEPNIQLDAIDVAKPLQYAR